MLPVKGPAIFPTLPPGPGAMDNQLALGIGHPMTTARLIDEAEGLAFLGLYVDAWEVLESLPPADRVRPAVLAIRLMVCLGTARWELGQEVARCIGADDEASHREAAGRFHLGHAIALCAAGEVQLARGAVGALSVVWRGRRGAGCGQMLLRSRLGSSGSGDACRKTDRLMASRASCLIDDKLQNHAVVLPPSLEPSRAFHGAGIALQPSLIQ